MLPLLSSGPRLAAAGQEPLIEAAAMTAAGTGAAAAEVHLAAGTGCAAAGAGAEEVANASVTQHTTMHAC